MINPFRSAVVRCRLPQGCSGAQVLRTEAGAIQGHLVTIGWALHAEHGWICPRHGGPLGAGELPKPALTPRTLTLIAAIRDGHDFGLAITRATGLSESTVYATLRRLRAAGWAVCELEPQEAAVRRQRPQRKIYRLTELLLRELGRPGRTDPAGGAELAGG